MTAEQILEAGRLWNRCLDTKHIAKYLRISEAVVYARIDAVRTAATALRNAEWKAA